MEDEGQVVDATAVEELDEASPPPPPGPATPASTELAHRVSGSTDLISGATAKEKIAVAAEIATALDHVIKAQGMRTKMGQTKVVKADGREVWEDRYHVNVEAWQTLATLLGLAVIPVWSRRVLDPETGQPLRIQYTARVRRYYSKKDGGGLKSETTYDVDGFDWESRVEVYKDGVLIAAGEGMCSRTEDTWHDRDEYAVRGMAMTRATSRAIAGAARWIVTLAGYSGTPAEEYGAHEAPAGEQAPALERLPVELRDTVMQALAVLLSPTDEHAPAEHVTDVAKNIASIIGGPMPKVLGLSIMGMAGRRQRLNKEHAAQAGVADAGDEHGADTEPPDVDSAASDDRPPAGTVAMPDLSGAQTQKDAEQLLRDAGCTCPKPLSAGAKPADTDDSCPLADHGIPF